jgi:3-oxoadipate enol-lactonase
MAGLILYHERTGPADAPGLLLVGSLGTTLEMWDPQVAALAGRRSLVRVDVRGHGRSPAPAGAYSIAELAMDVAATLDQLGIRRIAVCGLSIGGMIGMWLAAHAPDRVERLALICTSSHMPEAAAAYRDRAQVVRSEGSTEPIADGVIERWFTSTWAREHAETVAGFRQMLCGTPAGGYAGCCEALAALDLRSALPRIAAPTLVIAGTEDRATPPAHAEAIVAAVPGARLEVLADAAHLASVQRPDAVTQLIDEHLTRR